MTHSHLHHPSVASLKNETEVNAEAGHRATTPFSINSKGTGGIALGSFWEKAGVSGNLRDGRLKAMVRPLQGREHAVPFPPQSVLSALPEKGIIYLVSHLYENSSASGFQGSLAKMVPRWVTWRRPQKEHDMNEGK